MKGGEKDGDGKDVFGKVVGYLEEARKYSDVSAFGRVRRFNIKDGWQWKWDESKGNAASGSSGGQGVSEQSSNDEDDEDESDGGVGI